MSKTTKEEMKQEKETSEVEENKEEQSVYFFIPNLIGYFRVITMFLSFMVVFDDPRVFFILYFLSAFSDALDGHYARKFGQESNYGGVLDMVTDRCTTTGLIVVLSRFYPSYTFYWITIIAIDFTSHYAHMYSQLSQGLYHKHVTNRLLAIYYYKPVLFTLCAGNEAMFLAFYVLHFIPNSMFAVSFLYVTLPFGLFKQFLNVVQLFSAFRELNKYDMALRRAKRNEKKQI